MNPSTSTPPLQIVIDTNVCLDLFVFRDPRWEELLNRLKEGSIEALTREDCRSEWLAVLRYPHLPVAPEQLNQIITQFDTYIKCVSPVRKTTLLPRCSDKDDQKFLEIAFDSSAHSLITKDKALLKLARKFKTLGNLNILTPDKFIASLLCSTVVS